MVFYAQSNGYLGALENKRTDTRIINKKIIIIMYIYHALINALSAQMTHINLNTNEEGGRGKERKNKKKKTNWLLAFKKKGEGR